MNLLCPSRKPKRFINLQVNVKSDMRSVLMNFTIAHEHVSA